jgi:hypothetical protein
MRDQENRFFGTDEATLSEVVAEALHRKHRAEYDLAMALSGWLENLAHQNELLGARIGRLRHMAKLNFDKMEDAARREQDAGKAVVDLLTDIATQLKDDPGNQAKVDEIADGMLARAQSFADAVVANTPAQPSGA